ncbi:MAG: OB-fold nucleic acid binding domain-containing protein [Candidatus Woesearchaeota archaeon]|nr:OB-fold nucleic acid binding domain-containing protein [Candidatus Woesearchaeota archaeon]
MMDIPYEQAVEKITTEANTSAEEIEQKVKAKLEELSGLISKDGAIHIVANELGVKLTPEVKESGGEVTISSLTVGMRGAIVTAKVLQKYDVKEFDKNGRQGKVASMLVGDASGITRLVFWNDQVEIFQELKENDILKVTNPFVKESYMKDRLELQMNDQSQLTVNPEGVTVEVKPRETQDRTPKYIKDLQGGEQNIEVVATIVQVFDPVYYDACPECRKKAENNLCPTHGEVTSEPNFNVSLFIDDGTGNIRTSFWKKQAIQLTGLTDEQMVSFRENPAGFEEKKNDLLGEIIKVVGSVKKNEQYDRIEMNAQLVFTDVDPAVEMKNLEQKFESNRKEAPTETPKEEPKMEEPVVVGETAKPKIKEEVISLDQLEEMGK